MATNEGRCEPPPELRDRDGWHWVGKKPRLWVAQFQMWESDIGGRMVKPDAYWLGVYGGPCLIAPVTPPATVAALVEALEAAERKLVLWYRLGSPAGNVGDGNAFADNDQDVQAARAALALYRGAGR